MKTEQGFTLVEVMTVTAIITIVLGFAIPNYSKWVEKHRINTESQKLYHDLMLARTWAVKNNNNVMVTFDAGGNGYQIHDDTSNDGTQDAGERIKSVSLHRGVKFGINGTVQDMDNNTILSPVFLGGVTTNSTITFNSRGESNLSGSLYLIPVSDVGENNGRVRGISIIQATGGIDLWKYDAGASPPWS